MAQAWESAEIRAIGDQWAMIQRQLDQGGLSALQVVKLKNQQKQLNKKAEALRAQQGYSGGASGDQIVIIEPNPIKDKPKNGGSMSSSVTVCPITVEDVERTRGTAFLTLTPQQQQACGGFSGTIYQEGLRRAFEKGRDEGMPEIDLSDNMTLENMQIALNNLWANIRNDLGAFFTPALFIGGFLVVLTAVRSIFGGR